jgi:hypothetical protein
MSGQVVQVTPVLRGTAAARARANGPAFPARCPPERSPWRPPCACRRSSAPPSFAPRALLLPGSVLPVRPAPVASCCAARRTALTSWTWTAWPRSRRRSPARRAPGLVAAAPHARTAVGGCARLQRHAFAVCCFATALAHLRCKCHPVQREQIAAQREAIARQRAALEAQQTEVVQSSSSGACPCVPRQLPTAHAGCNAAAPVRLPAPWRPCSL